MKINNSKISIITCFLRGLTWTRLFELFLISVVIASLVILSQYLITDNKSKASNIKLLEISSESKTKIRGVNKKLDHVLAIHIITFDFERNLRVETYADVDNANVRSMYESFLRNKVYDAAIFTSDMEANQKTLRIMNGEFVCVPYNKSTAYKYVPAASYFITDICALSIPPFNHVSGILTFYFSRNITEDEKSEIYSFAKAISAKIYDDTKEP
jgi:hypothetical protein